MLLRSSRIPLAALIMSQLAGSALMAQTLVGDGTVICGATYTVESGDTLSRLADRAYGSGELYEVLLDSNYDQLGGNPDLLAVGMEINVPCLDSTGETAAVDISTAVNAEGPLSAAELDALFGPIALFPDPLLNQILYAVTLPLDVVKAGRFVSESSEMTDQERAAAASEQDWDPSVRTLAAAYPDLVTKMSDHIDWTEQAGEAVLAQTDDVLDTVQRLRTEAMDNGYLVDNEAQNVEVADEVVTIVPAQPDVIYVPTYDSQVVYTTPISSPPMYYYDDDDDPYYYDDWDDALVGGAIFLGSAIVLDEIFDDNDWDDIGGWDGDDVDVDWDRGEINIDRGDIDIDRGDINGGDINIDRDNVNIDRDNVNIGEGDRNRVTIGGREDRPAAGDRDRPDVGDRNRPEQARVDAERNAARQRIESRQATGQDVARLPTDRAQTNRPRTEARQPAGNRDQVSRPTQQRRPTAAQQQRRPETQRAQQQRQPQQRAQPQRRQDNAFARQQRPSGGNRQPSRNRPNRR